MGAWGLLERGKGGQEPLLSSLVRCHCHSLSLACLPGSYLTSILLSPHPPLVERFTFLP